LDEFVVMPNHVHGILVIDKMNINKSDCMGETNCMDETNCGDAINRVSTVNQKHPSKPGGITRHKNPMLHDNLPRVIRWYKGRVSFECRKHNPAFSWQPRFYDHVIRNTNSYQRISKYIRNNPACWRQDQFSEYK
jgi:hypothetical protein